MCISRKRGSYPGFAIHTGYFSCDRPISGPRHHSRSLSTRSRRKVARLCHGHSRLRAHCSSVPWKLDHRHVRLALAILVFRRLWRSEPCPRDLSLPRIDSCEESGRAFAHAYSREFQGNTPEPYVHRLCVLLRFGLLRPLRLSGRRPPGPDRRFRTDTARIQPVFCCGHDSPRL